jgi:REP element-mobilizing transposase RayT
MSNGGLVLRRTPQAVYETLYHLVWSPTYRRDGLPGEGQRRGQALCGEIAEPYALTSEEMDVSPEQGHLCCACPPR